MPDLSVSRRGRGRCRGLPGPVASRMSTRRDANVSWLKVGLGRPGQLIAKPVSFQHGVEAQPSLRHRPGYGDLPRTCTLPEPQRHPRGTPHLSTSAGLRLLAQHSRPSVGFCGGLQDRRRQTSLEPSVVRPTEPCRRLTRYRIDVGHRSMGRRSNDRCQPALQIRPAAARRSDQETEATTGQGEHRTGTRRVNGSCPWRWPVRRTLPSTCWVHAPLHVRFPPQTFRVTTSGRISCSAQ